MPDTRYLAYVARELRHGERDEALWERALADAGDDPLAAHSLYIERRVEVLRRTDPACLGLVPALDATQGAEPAAAAASHPGPKGYQAELESLKLASFILGFFAAMFGAISAGFWIAVLLTDEPVLMVGAVGSGVFVPVFIYASKESHAVLRRLREQGPPSR